MVDLTRQITQNLEMVREKIEQAAIIATRDPAEVKLVVVSKAQPLEVIRAAYQSGIRQFGENYPQETEEKISQLTDLSGIGWHMIGHLQSRKAPIVARCFNIIHSIDSLSLAEKLNRALSLEGKVMPALLEINVSAQDSKFGWKVANEHDWPELLPDIQAIIALPQLKVTGLMTMPPLFDNPENARPFFQNLRHLRDYLASEFAETAWKDLSMGTSADFEIAIQEGATFVRIGQAILGPRPQP